MKSKVIYFSQTGNTQKIAETICNAIKPVTGECETIKLQSADVSKLAEYDLIGLGCPSFAYAEPVNVRDFIRGMGALRGKHCFIFATHGGHPGNVLTSLAAKLRRQGLKVLGGFNCDGQDHMPHFTSPWYTDGHPDEADHKAAADFGREMAERSRKISRGERVPMPKFQWLRDNFYEEHHRTTQVNKPLSQGFDFPMTLDKTTCRYPRCRLCMDNCPVKAIDLSVDPIIFRKGCISCYFCEMLCPTGSIKIDTTNLEPQRRVRLESFGRRKYAEFFETAKTSLIGNRSTLYRMLVDKVEIGNTHQMYGETFTRRPRYVIRDRNK